jgi:hypothetical protein
LPLEGDVKQEIAALILVLGALGWGCGTADRSKGSGGSGGSVEEGTGGSTGSGGKAGPGSGGSAGQTASGGSTGSGGSASTGGSAGATTGKDASVDGPSVMSSDGPAMSGGDLWAKCGPEAYKADVSAADFCARYISVCKASVSMDACATMYNGLSDGPRRCRACTAYYACIASSADVMAMSCLYISQGLAKNGPCKPSYCD